MIVVSVSVSVAVAVAVVLASLSFVSPWPWVRYGASPTGCQVECPAIEGEKIPKDESDDQVHVPTFLVCSREQERRSSWFGLLFCVLQQPQYIFYTCTCALYVINLLYTQVHNPFERYLQIQQRWSKKAT
jgi:hypothetical protein